MKRWIFRYFPGVAVTVLALGIWLAFALPVQDKLAVVGALIAGVLSFCYFIQQQRLAEMHLFVELFTNFNARYDKLNDKLGRITSTNSLTTSDRQVVVDYLNLCAEEYLFFKEGYILPSVWTTWCRGMGQYVDREPFSSIWRDELASQSYYGLSNEIIREGAAYPANAADKRGRSDAPPAYNPPMADSGT
jgi:hypothetical protein